MRVGVISDIHGNLHALEAVLTAVDAEGVDVVWCLGDVVGYGPRPNECCSLVAERAAICLVGNHDLGVLGRISLDEFSHEAAAAARWTAQVLDPGARAFLERLQPALDTERVTLAHGSVRDPVWEYVLSRDAARASLAVAARRVALVGHSHAALVFTDDESFDGGLAVGGTEVDLAEPTRWLLNPGSVGQPRDGDPRAAWLLLDDERMHASWRRAEYPVERTQQEIVERGLPDSLALRLADGF
ncbi:MAG: metallophosphoesterase family protein [Thermoleophilia bacterium]